MDASVLRNYLHKIKNDWNYITPIDFYKKYYVNPSNYSVNLA